MAKRVQRKKAAVTAPKVVPLSDAAKLFYAQMMAPWVETLQAVEKRAQQAQGAIATHCAELDNKPPGDGWQFNVDTMEWQK